MSTIKANTIENTSGGATTLTGLYPARAWVNFNGAGTVAIRDDGNISSVTDNGTGDYLLSFSTTTSSANYAVSVSASDNTTAGQTSGYAYGAWARGSVLYSTTGFSFRVGYPASANVMDQEFVNVLVVE